MSINEAPTGGRELARHELTPPEWLDEEHAEAFGAAAAALAATGIDVDQRHAYGLALLTETVSIYRRLADAARVRSLIDVSTGRRDPILSARAEAADQVRRLLSDLGMLAPRAAVTSARATTTTEDGGRGRYAVS